MFRFGLSHYHEHDLKNNFQDTLKPLCTRSCDVENTYHFLNHCTNFHAEKNTALPNKITNKSSRCYLEFGNSKYSNGVNLQIINASIDFVLTSKIFDEPLLIS